MDKGISSSSLSSSNETSTAGSAPTIVRKGSDKTNGGSHSYAGKHARKAYARKTKCAHASARVRAHRVESGDRQCSSILSMNAQPHDEGRRNVANHGNLAALLRPASRARGSAEL